MRGVSPAGSGIRLHTVAAALPADDSVSWSLLQRAERVPGSSGPRGATPGLAKPVSARGASALRAHRATRATANLVDLEEEVADGLAALLQEARSGVQLTRQCAARRNDDTIGGAQRSCSETELEFRGLLPMREAVTSGGSAGSAAVPESRMTHQPPSTLGPSSLPQQVAVLLDICQRQMARVSAKDDAVAAQVLAATTGLGDLLLEVEQDCDAMALALAGSEDCATDFWVERMRLSVAHAGRGTSQAPHATSLLHQLQAENRLLREALRRPPVLGRRPGGLAGSARHRGHASPPPVLPGG